MNRLRISSNIPAEAVKQGLTQIGIVLQVDASETACQQLDHVDDLIRILCRRIISSARFPNSSFLVMLYPVPARAVSQFSSSPSMGIFSFAGTAIFLLP